MSPDDDYITESVSEVSLRGFSLSSSSYDASYLLSVLEGGASILGYLCKLNCPILAMGVNKC